VEGGGASVLTIEAAPDEIGADSLIKLFQ